MVVARSRLEKCQSNRESANARGSMDGEGDGPRGKFFPSSAQTKHNATFPLSISCNRMPASAVTRYLQTVVQLGPPLFLLQQSVVSQKHRVHAGRGGSARLKMVRRLP